MDEHLLDSGSGDAIARDWELPELPSGMLSYSTDQLRSKCIHGLQSN